MFTALGRFVPRLTLQTLSRGEGLLGLKPFGKLGPRGDSVTVVRLDWTYRHSSGARWQTAAPTSILNNRPPSTVDAIDADGRVVRPPGVASFRPLSSPARTRMPA